MQVRPIALAALAVSVLAGFAADATTTQRYRVDSTNDATLDGTATGAATYWVAVDGRMVGATMNENAAMTITVEQAPAPIPVKSTNVVTISSIR
mgnify:CR=1 FL=1